LSNQGQDLLLLLPIKLYVRFIETNYVGKTPTESAGFLKRNILIFLPIMLRKINNQI